MGSNYNPKIVTDGLVLALDAASLKSILNNVEVLVVAGGGGGGTGGGGGGAGGLIYSSSYSVTPGSAITATVGDGGVNTSTWGVAGGAGGNSVFGALTAIGGGAGQHRSGSTSSGIGGSGGGDAGGSGFTLSNATSGQGFSGGNSPKNGTTLEEPGGGGGGAGGAGENASTPSASDAATVRATAAGAGGPGLPFNISGSVVYYAGGGGGSNRNGVGRLGGIGGGGTGGISPTAGTPNTGGGGGGTGYSGYGGGGTSAIGGSGIVIVRYPGSQRASGGTVTSVGGYTIHTFTASGTFTPGWGDLSGLGNSGTITSTTTETNGIVFDGSTSYATLADLGFFTSANNFRASSGYAWSISVWFKFPTSPVTSRIGNASYALCGHGGGIGGGETLTLFVGSGTDATYGSYVPYYCAVGIFGTKTIISPAPVNTNTWNNVVITWNGSAGRSYFNGIDRGTLNIGVAALQTGYLFGIGQVGITSHTPNTVQLFEGSLSNFLIYNYGLSDTQVTQNFNALRGRYNI